MALILYILAGVAFAGGLIYLIVASAMNKPVKPAFAVMLASLLLGFLGFAACTAEVVGILS